MNMRKLRVLLGSLFLVVALAASLAVPVAAQPPVTSPFTGTVTIDGVAAPVGTDIDVYVDGDLEASTTTTTAGWYEVVVFGESADVGSPVTFEVDGLAATSSPASPVFASYQPQTVNIAASSGIATYTLTVTASPSAGGSVSKSPNQTSYNSGTVVTLTASEASGYDFSFWSGAASGTSTTTTVTMTSNKSVTANFVEEGGVTPEPPEEDDPEINEGSEGDWLYDSTIAQGPGPILQTSDGTLYVYAQVMIDSVLEHHVFDSDDGGRSWDKTDYWKDLDDPGRVIDMVASSMDEDTIYAADGQHVYFTENGGGKWETLGDYSLGNVLVGTITSLDVAFDDRERAYVFIGSATNDGSYDGTVYWISQEGYPSEWTDLEIGNYDVYAVGAAPDFEDSDQLFALATNDDPYTAVMENLNGAIGDWDEYGEEMLDSSDDSFEVEPVAGTWFGASRFGFPSDFDEGEELFIGVVAKGTDGSVFRVTDGDAYNLGNEDSDVKHDIVSLALMGETADTTMLAGSTVTGADKIIYSTNDGDSWSDADKEPSGLGRAWVAMDKDFEDNETAWAAVDGVEGAVSLTVDGGLIYNGISLINTDIDEIKSISFSRDYASDETYFMLTSDNNNDTDSLWLDDGDDWTRVFVSNLSEPNLDNIDLVQIADDDTVYVTSIGSNPTVFRSTDMGDDWDDLVRDPPELYSWIVVDEDTIFAGADGTVYITDDHGRREWDKETVSGAGRIIGWAMSPDVGSDETLLAGDDDGGVFITEDMGDEWDQVGEDLDGNGETYVAFDADYGSSMLIYAASDDMAARCEIDTSDDWDDQDWDEFKTGDTDLDLVEASGLRALPNALYISDRTPVDEDEEGGVWRSINPDASDLDDVLFELVQEDLDDGAELYTLQVTMGSNTVWALNAQSGAENQLWDWEDYLVDKVKLTDPSDGEDLSDTDEVRFQWEELENSDGDDSADEYELRYGEDLDDKYEKVTDIDDNDYFTDDLDSGTEYLWKVRALEPFRSPWSNVFSFTSKVGKVGAPVGVAPEPGATDVVLNPVFDWEKVTGASFYKITLATDAAFSNVMAEGESKIDTWSPDITLKHDTVYYWKVAAYSSSGAPAGSAVTSVFRTMPEPEEAPPPVVIEENPPAQITLPPPVVNIPPAPAPITPAFIWAIIIIGAILVIAVIVLIVRTRRVS
ncbi:hypothetical protein ACFLV5_01345 [Chloroflexota bacterium]